MRGEEWALMVGLEPALVFDVDPYSEVAKELQLEVVEFWQMKEEKDGA